MNDNLGDAGGGIASPMAVSGQTAGASAGASIGGSSGRSSGKGRILVVDDDRLVLATVSHGLASAGYEVIDADNGDDAILLAREHRPDLALLDIRMEGKSGFDVAAYLREYLQLPFMFLSAFTDERTLSQVKALGAVAYLVKPLDISQIVPAVDAALGHARSHHAPRALASHCALPPPPALSDAVPIAVGVLMQRYAVSRQAALERLAAQAAGEGLSIQAQADNLLRTLEMPSRPPA